MQKKHILIFILAFFFFLQTLPVFAQGVQCDSCGTSITYSNFGAKTEKGDYLCKDCYRQQQEHPQQQEQPKQKQTQSQQQKQQQIPQLQQQQTQKQQQMQGRQCDNCGTSITDNNLGATIIYKNNLDVKTKTGYLCKNCYHQRQKEQPKQQQKQTQQEQKQQQKQTQSQQIQPKQRQQQQAQGMQCDNCGISITSYSLFGSKTKTGYLCKKCYRNKQEEQQQRIQLKKQWIQQQQSKQKEQETKQKEHQKQQTKQQEPSQKKVCSLCNSPFVAGENYYLSPDNKPFCSTCYNKTFKCTLCNKPFAGKKYYLIHDKSFCSTCYNTFKEKCKTCGYLIPPGEEVRNGSWVVCTSCSKDIVTTDSLLKACYAEACKFMKAYLGLDVPVPVDNVYFSDMTEMTEKAKKSGTDYATDAVGLFSEGKNILCQKGMSKQDSVKVLVHESAHACMHQFGTDKKASPMYEEGFAEWCAYKYIISIGKTWDLQKDRIYTEGLRKMLELEKKMTEDGLLEYVKTHNDFPKE